jgi:hypothetical protein
MAFSSDSKFFAFVYQEGLDSKAVAYEWFHKNRVFG